MFKPHNNNELSFSINGDGTYVPYPGVLARLISTTVPMPSYVVTATNQATYRFNPNGQLLNWMDAQGNSWVYTYTSGLLTRVADNTTLRFLNFSYDGNQRLTSVSDPLNRVMQYGYNASGDLAVITDTRGFTWTYQYSGTTHLLTDIIDPLGNTVAHTDYDGQGRAIRQFDALNVKTYAVAYNLGGTRTITDAVGQVITATYDTRGTLVKAQDAAGITQKQFDGNFRVSQLTDPNGNASQLTWSTSGANLTRTVDAQGNTTNLRYDSLNNLTRTTDALSRTTSFVYSGTLLTRATDALTNTTLYTYTPQGFLSAQTDARGNTTNYTYNAFGQRTSMSDALGNLNTYGYDNVGRLITTTDALSRTMINSYDNGDQLIQVTQNYLAGQPQNYQTQYNLVTQYGYDKVGRQILITDTLGRVTQNGYDANGRLVKVTSNVLTGQAQNYLNEHNLVTQFGYDKMGRQILVTDTVGHVTFNQYDLAGRLVTVTQNYLAGQAQNYQNQYNIISTNGYDAAGNLIARTDTLGRMTRTQVDALNRPVTVTVNYVDGIFDVSKPDEDLITITRYDAVGNVASMTDALGRVTQTTYDALNRPSTLTTNYLTGQAQNYQTQYNLVTQYGYDGVGNRTLITDTLGRVSLNAYDALNRAFRVTQNYAAGQAQNYLNEYNLVTTYGFDAVSNRTAMTDTLGRVTTSQYDALNRQVAQVDFAGQPSTTRYDALSNRLVMTDTLGNTTRLAYDTLNRVITTTRPLN